MGDKKKSLNIKSTGRAVISNHRKEKVEDTFSTISYSQKFKHTLQNIYTETRQFRYGKILQRRR